VRKSSVKRRSKEKGLGVTQTPLGKRKRKGWEKRGRQEATDLANARREPKTSVEKHT